jgi:hypothetical protein
MDWHHPDGARDGARCATDEAARQRFVEYTHGLIRELMTNYGKIDVLWGGDQLHHAGTIVEEDAFVTTTPLGPITLTNIVAKIRGAAPSVGATLDRVRDPP